MVPGVSAVRHLSLFGAAFPV